MKAKPNPKARARFISDGNDYTITPPKPKQKAFDESDVNRDESGQFAEQAGGGGEKDTPKQLNTKQDVLDVINNTSNFDADGKLDPALQVEVDDYINLAPTSPDSIKLEAALAEAEGRSPAEQTQKKEEEMAEIDSKLIAQNEKLQAAKDSGEITSDVHFEAFTQMIEQNKVDVAALNEKYPDAIPPKSPERETSLSGDGETRTFGDRDFENIPMGQLEDDANDFFSSFEDTESGRAQVESVREYTGVQYENINLQLRDPGDRVGSANAQRNIDNIDNLMSQSTIEENIRVYRGGSGGSLPNMGRMTDNEFLGLNGQVMKQDGYLSTSVNPGDEFNRKYNYEFLVPVGAQGMYVNSISKTQGESEMILARGSSYRILETSIGRGDQRKIVAEIIGQEFNLDFP